MIIRQFLSAFFSSRRRHTRWNCVWSSDVCSSDLLADFHKATPFHGRTHSRISAKNQMFCEISGSICYYNKIIPIYIQAKFMESYNKLVRDKIPVVVDHEGVAYEKRIASDEEYKAELVKKLGEETEEFLKDNSPEELADVIEVIEDRK